MGVPQRAHPGHIHMPTTGCIVMQWANGSSFCPWCSQKQFCFSEVYTAVKFTWSSACWEAGPASLSAMHEPVSISFPFNPWAWLTLPCGTHKSGVSTPRLRSPMVFQQSQAVLQEEARSGVDKRVLAQPYSILGTGHSTSTEGLRD